jgi:hypothetical protein
MNKPGIKIKKLPRIKAKPRTSETVKSENQTRNSTKTAESHKDTFKRRKKKVKTDKNSKPALIPCQYNEKTRIPNELLFMEKLPLSVPCFASYTWVFSYTWSLIDS